MVDLAKAAAPDETGGVLVGYDAGNGLVVEAITGPGPNATHKPHAFEPDHEHQEKEIARIYACSGRRHTYLGDWHSHPGGGVDLSSQDRRTLRAISRHKPARMPEPLMVIVSGIDDWTVAAWRCRPPRLRAGRFTYRYEHAAVRLMLAS
jgi:integrative and conjugative element protein (TIGR02256 family)